MDPSFDQLTPAEQIQHVQDLWDRISEHPEGVPVSDEMKVELDRRLAAHRADPSSSIRWRPGLGDELVACVESAPSR